MFGAGFNPWKKKNGDLKEGILRGKDLPEDDIMPKNILPDINPKDLPDWQWEGVIKTPLKYTEMLLLYVRMPADIALNWPEFQPVFNVQRTREIDKAKLDRIFAEKLAPYYKLSRKAMAKVDNALIAGDIEGAKLYSDEVLREKFNLTDKEILAYNSVRRSLNAAFHLLIREMESVGIAKEKIAEFRAMAKGYVPHKWYGEWAVVVKDAKTGDTKFMSAVNYAAKNKEKIRLAKLYPDDEVFAIKRKNIPYEAFQQAPPHAVQKMIDLAVEKAQQEGMDAGLDPKQIEGLKQALSDLYKAKGFGMHYIKRKGVPGYTENLARPIAEYFAGFTGYLSKIRAMREFPKAMKGIKPNRTPNLWKYNLEYYNYVTGQPYEFGPLKQAAYFYYLYANIKSASLNLTQNFVRGWPVLSKYTGFALPKMSQAMARTAAHALTKGEKEFIAALEKEGYLDPKLAQEISGYMGNPIYRVAGMKRMRQLVQLFDFFRHVERFNRRAMAVALYDAGIRDLNRASKIIEEAHDRYGKGNRPILGRGPISPLLTFRSYTINYLTWLTNEIKRGRINPVLKSLFALLFFGGIAAFPGYKKFLEPWYIEKFGMTPTQHIKKVLGDWWGGLISHGAPSKIGINFTGSVGFPDILPTDLKEFGGVFADIPDRIGRAEKSLRAEDYDRFIEDISPEVIRNPLAAWRLYTTFATSRGGRPVLDIETLEPMKLTAREAAFKAAGFYPQRLAEQREIQETLETIKRKRTERKQAWADRYNIARLEGNEKKMKKIEQEIIEFNGDALRIHTERRRKELARKKKLTRKEAAELRFIQKNRNRLVDVASHYIREYGPVPEIITWREIRAMMRSRARPVNIPPRYMSPKLQELRKPYEARTK